MRYGYTKRIGLAFADSVRKAKEELAEEGFGILTEIDVRTTLKKKLDVEYENYLILGACNPKLSYKALQAEKEIGLFLPCNVVVYEESGSVFVSAVLPTAAMQAVDNEEVHAVAKEAEQRLRKVIDAI